MNEASSEARKRTAPAISSGSATRPSGVLVDHRRGRLLREHVRELCLHVARRDDVRADVPRPELARERLGEADDPGLRRGVVRLAPVAVHADDRADVDDRPRALLHHRPGHCATRVEDRAEVRVDHRAPVVVGHAREQAVASQAGVVDEHVDVAGLVDEPLRVFGRRDVGLDRAAADLRRRATRPRPCRSDSRRRPRAPARASSSAIARPMPREAPVTSASFPSSDANGTSQARS